jgi:hypothetical protein
METYQAVLKILARPGKQTNAAWNMIPAMTASMTADAIPFILICVTPGL